MNWLVDHEPLVRGAAFFGIFALMAGWEVLAPRRGRLLSRWLRWSNNIGLVVLNTVVLRLLFPVAAVGMAAWAQAQGWGVLNLWAGPAWLEILIAVVVLDFIIWLQHVVFHAVPLLWRLHRVHHADLDYDLTTGARFHPVEIVLSMLIKLAAVALLGPAAAAVVIFEVLLNATAMFNHANARLPLGLDAVLRWLIVTPDMHRVHHSVEADETNSNFGFNLSCWDRLFGTYTAQPRAGHQAMQIGLHGFEDPRQVSWLSGLLLMPFIRKLGNYPINRRSWPQQPPE